MHLRGMAAFKRNPEWDFSEEKFEEWFQEVLIREAEISCEDLNYGCSEYKFDDRAIINSEHVVLMFICEKCGTTLHDHVTEIIRKTLFKTPIKCRDHKWRVFVHAKSEDDRADFIQDLVESAISKLGECEICRCAGDRLIYTHGNPINDDGEKGFFVCQFCSGRINNQIEKMWKFGSSICRWSSAKQVEYLKDPNTGEAINIAIGLAQIMFIKEITGKKKKPKTAMYSYHDLNAWRAREEPYLHYDSFLLNR